MPTDVAAAKRGLAEIAARAIVSTDKVLSVCVFGSVARGQASDDSDIDMLVLGTDEELDPVNLYESAPLEVREAGLTIVYFTPDSLARHLQNAGVFGAHLRRDGWMVYDPNDILVNLLNTNPVVRPRDEIQRQLKLLRGLGHSERFGGRFLFPLSHVYRIGRTITYTQLVDRNILEFDQKTAFRILARLEPDWSQAVLRIERLAPFYSWTRSRDSVLTPPFDPNGPDAETEFLAAYDAVLTIAGTGIKT